MGRILDLFLSKYNYTDFHELNLDWMIQTMKEIIIQLDNFVNLNTIKYADPIQWNITKQYEANTVVIDGNTGTAYISTTPVPSGVALTNTDYWTVIFTLDILSANDNITFRNDGANVIATFASAENDWLLWNSQLYKVIRPITINEAYVSGYNLQRYSVEMFIKDYITEVKNIIGDLDDLTTSDKSSIVNSINSLNSTIGDLDDLTTSDKSSVVNSINSLKNYLNLSSFYVTPEQFGAVGDGVTDDTQAINDAFESIPNGGTVALVSGKTYKISSNIMIKYSNQTFIGYGAKIITDNTTGASYSISARSRNYVEDQYQPDARLSNINIIGVTVEGGVQECCIVANCDHVTIKDCNFIGSESDAMEIRYSRYFVIDNCHVQPKNYYGIMLYQDIYGEVCNCNIDGYMQGITVKGHIPATTSVNINIHDNIIKVLGAAGVGVGSGVDSAEGDVVNLSILNNILEYQNADKSDGIGVRLGRLSRRSVVSNNRFIQFGMLVSGDHHKISNNYFESYTITTRPTIQLLIVTGQSNSGYSEISNNKFMGTNVNQPYITASDTNITIDGNLFNGGKSGFDVQQAGSFGVFTNNVTINSTNGLYQEFGTAGDNYNTITNNKCLNNTSTPYDLINTRDIFEDNYDLAYYRDGQAPTAGKHYKGEFKKNNNPSISGTKVLTGWLCTVTGTPGTWTPCYSEIS